MKICKDLKLREYVSMVTRRNDFDDTLTCCWIINKSPNPFSMSLLSIIKYQLGENHADYDETEDWNIIIVKAIFKAMDDVDMDKAINDVNTNIQTFLMNQTTTKISICFGESDQTPSYIF